MLKEWFKISVHCTHLYLAGSRVSLQHGSPPWNVPTLTICSGSCEEPFLTDVRVLSHFGASGHLTSDHVQ